MSIACKSTVFFNWQGFLVPVELYACNLEKSKAQAPYAVGVGEKFFRLIKRDFEFLKLLVFIHTIVENVEIFLFILYLEKPEVAV